MRPPSPCLALTWLASRERPAGAPLCVRDSSASSMARCMCACEHSAFPIVVSESGLRGRAEGLSAWCARVHACRLLLKTLGWEEGRRAAEGGKLNLAFGAGDTLRYDCWRTRASSPACNNSDRGLLGGVGAHVCRSMHSLLGPATAEHALIACVLRDCGCMSRGNASQTVAALHACAAHRSTWGATQLSSADTSQSIELMRSDRIRLNKQNGPCSCNASPMMHAFQISRKDASGSCLSALLYTHQPARRKFATVCNKKQQRHAPIQGL